MFLAHACLLFASLFISLLLLRRYILAGMDRPNLRQDLDNVLRSRGVRCMDIRAREVQGQQALTQSAELVVRRYDGSGADEYFVSFETPDRGTIFGFARVRLGGDSGGLCRSRRCGLR